MPTIEQAVFLIKVTDPLFSAQMLLHTSGFHVLDGREILDWFSGRHGEQLIRHESPGYFFHPLPSGRFALARIIPRRTGFRGLLRQEGSFYVHLLSVAPKTLLQNGNSPVKLIRGIETRNAWLPLGCKPKALRPLKMARSEAILDRKLLMELLERIRPEALASLLQLSFDQLCTLFTSSFPPEKIIDGLINLLPVRWRSELTFSTNLHLSPRRPIKMVACSETVFDPELPVVDLEKSPETFASNDRRPPLDSWSLFIVKVLENRDFDFLERCLIEDFLENPQWDWEEMTQQTELEKLHEFGRRCLLGLNHAAEEDMETPTIPAFSKPDSTALEADGLFFHRAESVENASLIPASLAGILKPLTGMPGKSRYFRSTRISPFEENLTLIDSCTTRALFGDESAMESLRKHWRTIAEQLPWSDRCAIRAEYIELVQGVITHPIPFESAKKPERSIDALEVLDIFLQEY